MPRSMNPLKEFPKDLWISQRHLFASWMMLYPMATTIKINKCINKNISTFIDKVSAKPLLFAISRGENSLLTFKILAGKDFIVPKIIKSGKKKFLHSITSNEQDVVQVKAKILKI